MIKKNNNQKKRKSYTLKDKFEVIEYKNKHPRMSQADLSLKFNVSIGSVNSILKNKEMI